MADQINLTAEIREETGKGAASRMRREGRIPAVIYGQQRPTRSLAVDHRELYHALHTSAGMNVLITLKAGDAEQLAMPKSIQVHPVRGDYLHIDFVRIDTDVDIHVEIPVYTENDEKVRPGVVTVTLQQLPVVCKPLNVPDSVTLDVSELTIGDSIHAGEITLPEGVLLDVEEDRTVLTVTAPDEVEEEEEETVLTDEQLAMLADLSEEELAGLEEIAEAEEAEGEGGAEGEGAEAPAE